MDTGRRYAQLEAVHIVMPILASVPVGSFLALSSIRRFQDLGRFTGIRLPLHAAMEGAFRPWTCSNHMERGERVQP
jgi:hypothetical protein